jgi:hypothetical protein
MCRAMSAAVSIGRVTAGARAGTGRAPWRGSRKARVDAGDAGDLAQVDELKAEYFALAATDSAILAQVRAALTPTL